jgi:fibronectin-binding autotransporter adhesin
MTNDSRDLSAIPRFDGAGGRVPLGPGLSGIRCAGLAFALAACSAAPLAAQTTLSYGDGSTVPAVQLNGNWNDAGRWYDGTSWGDWVDGSVARFYNPASGANATITLGSAVGLGGVTKQADAGFFTVLSQAGNALNFSSGATISVNLNTLATQGGVISGNNLLMTGSSTGTVRIGPTTSDATANTINGVTLDTITLKLSKSNDVAAVGGAVVVNSGVLEHGASSSIRRDNQYAAGSTLTQNGGTVSVWSTAQTLDSFTYNAGTFTIWAGANLNLGGTDALTLRNVTLTRTGGSAGQTYNVNLTANGPQTVRFNAINNGIGSMGEGTALVLGGGEKTFNVENGTATTDMQVLVNSITETAASSIRKTGAGVVAWNVSGTNTYSNGMTVAQGALFFAGTNSLPASGVTVSDGAVLGLRMYNSQFTEQQFLDLHAGTLAGVTMGATAYAGWENIGDLTLGASLTGTRGLAKLGGGNLILTGESDYTGGTWINQGNLQVGAGGTTGSITGNVFLNPAGDSFRQLIFNRSDTVTFGGVISGGGSVRQDGSGTLVLTGNNTHTGPTNVAAGTLVVDGDQSGANGAVTVSAGAMLGGEGILGGVSTISGGLAPGAAGGGIGTLTFTRNVTWNSGNDWLFELGAAGASIGSPGVSDLLSITGNNNFLKGSGSSWTFDFAGTGDVGWYKLADWTGGGTTFLQEDFTATNLAAGATGNFVIQGEALYLQVVPEPSALVLLALAAVGLGGHHVLRRRRDRGPAT